MRNWASWHSSLQRRARRIVAAGVVAAMAGLVMGPASPAHAAPETETIDFGAAQSAPADGTLANQVEWSVDLGSVENTAWGLSNSGVNTLSFDRPVDLRFGVSGLNASNEDVQLPTGTEVDELDPSHTWDPVNSVVAGPGASCQDCVSTFVLEDTTALTAQPLSNLTWVRGITFIEVTYDLPVAAIAGPVGGESYELGGGEPLSYTCTDGTGAVTGSATIDGDPIDNGAAVDDLGPGSHTIEVTCTDEHGAMHSTSVTFDVVDSTPPTVVIDGPADDAGVPHGSELVADFSCDDLDLESCTAVDGDGNPIVPGQELDTSRPGTFTITVTGTDASGNETTVTHTYTVLPPPCAEDGLQVLQPPHSNYFDLIDLQHKRQTVSGQVHKIVEPALAAGVDPITELVGLPVSPLIHRVNCDLVVPVEDAIDEVAIPVVTEAKRLLRGLFG